MSNFKKFQNLVCSDEWAGCKENRSMLLIIPHKDKYFNLGCITLTEDLSGRIIFMVKEWSSEI